MDDLHSFHTRSYDKSDELEEIKPWQKAISLLIALPLLLVKLLIILLALIFEVLKFFFFCIVPRPLNDIRDQLAVVTGGSNGIGREICLELARCGCSIACLDLDLDAAKQLCTELRLLGVKANAYKVDVTDPKRVKEVKKEINRDLGHVDILVNNAGLMPKTSLREGETDDIRRLVDVNVLSHFWTTRTFIEDMIERRTGYIVGIASMIAFYPVSSAVLYTTSKYAVKGFMDALTRESRHENWGVKTLTVFPHLTNTRKEFTDYVKQIVPPSALKHIELRKPTEVAEQTVRALRTDAGYVSMPSYFLFVVKFYQFLPFKVQHICDRLIMPRISSKSNYRNTKK